MLRLIQKFATNKHIEYANYFLLEYKYVNDAYYKTAHNKPSFLRLIEKFEETLPVHIIGGIKYPMTGSTLLFNCQDQSIPNMFLKQDPLLKDKAVVDHQLTKLDKMSGEKFNRLAAFYSAY